MANALTVKGQVTIPKRVRDALGLKPGDEVEFEVGEHGAFVRRRAGPAAAFAQPRQPDGIDRAIGSADYKWGSTHEYMKFIRGDDYDQD